MGSCPWEHVLTCLASLTESLVRRERSWGSRWVAGAISTTFWCRRWMEQSRSYKCRMFPYWSPGHTRNWIQPFLEIQVTPVYPLTPWALWLLGHLTSALSQVPHKGCPKGCYCKPGRCRLLLFHTTPHSPRICTSMCLGFSMNFSTNNAPFPKAAKASE